jgi:glyoxylase-like metal-dependent hydrolase (beta-lactamase superfamily II)
MKVTALGSGDAFCSAGRGHTCWLIEDDRGLCCVDFGATALMALKRLGRDPEEVRAIHFTHLHGDHIAGWPFLLVDAVYRKERTAPLLASGPPGTAQRLQALWAACYARAAERPLPFPVSIHELSPGEAAVLEGRTIRAFAAQHMTAPDVALCLRVDDVAFTGDTGAIPDGLCDGAKLLCAECTDFAAGKETPPRHLSWSALHQSLPEVPRIVLGHLGEEARRQVPRSDRVRVCDDLESVEL